MAELYREQDASRFDTEELQKISIDGLTCTQVEEYFSEAIKEGRVSEDDDEEEKSLLTPKKKIKDKKKDKTPKKEPPTKSSSQPTQSVVTPAVNAKTTSVEVVDEDVAEESIDSGKKELPSSTVAQNQDDSLNGSNRRSSGIIKATNRHRSAAALGVVILGTGCLFFISKALKRR